MNKVAHVLHVLNIHSTWAGNWIKFYTIAQQRPEENNKERELKHLRGEGKRRNSLLAKETERRHKAEENMKQFQTAAAEATEALLIAREGAKGRTPPLIAGCRTT